MHRFYLAPEFCLGPILSLEGEEAHHALHVLRLKPGDRVTVLDGQGGTYDSEIVGTQKDRLNLKVCHQKIAPAPSPRIVLLQAIPKGKVFEAIIQKTTELGVATIVPVLAERTVPQFALDQAARKTGKWQQTAIEAIKQSGFPWLPDIRPPIGFPAALESCQNLDLQILASLQPNRRYLRDCLNDYRTQRGDPPRSFGVWIGPEGDFSPPEIDALLAGGVQPITLGQQILRVETAAIAALAILQYEAALTCGTSR